MTSRSSSLVPSMPATSSKVTAGRRSAPTGAASSRCFPEKRSALELRRRYTRPATEARRPTPSMSNDNFLPTSTSGSPASSAHSKRTPSRARSSSKRPWWQPGSSKVSSVQEAPPPTLSGNDNAVGDPATAGATVAADCVAFTTKAPAGGRSARYVTAVTEPARRSRKNSDNGKRGTARVSRRSPPPALAVGADAAGACKAFNLPMAHQVMSALVTAPRKWTGSSSQL
mmetsp:Transcript_16211/g.36620  ORF Transcript_16211/g.36620 Transcript_16211/m.36620 type:complete len:228 (-) Transcript_16211:153-836(-)